MERLSSVDMSVKGRVILPRAAFQALPVARPADKTLSNGLILHGDKRTFQDCRKVT